MVSQTQGQLHLYLTIQIACMLTVTFYVHKSLLISKTCLEIQQSH